MACATDYGLGVQVQIPAEASIVWIPNGPITQATGRGDALPQHLTPRAFPRKGYLIRSRTLPATLNVVALILHQNK